MLSKIINILNTCIPKSGFSWAELLPGDFLDTLEQAEKNQHSFTSPATETKGIDSADADRIIHAFHLHEVITSQCALSSVG